MRTYRTLLSTLLLLLVLTSLPLVAFAEDSNPSLNAPSGQAKLVLSTQYPAEVIGIDETAALNLKLHTDSSAQIVDLAVQDAPKDWTTSFRGSNHIVQQAFVSPAGDASVDLRIEPPKNVAAGDYLFNVIAKSEVGESHLPIKLTIKDKLPPRLSFAVELPTLRSKPGSTFRYDVTLKNEGDEDLNVNLTAQALSNLTVNYKLNGQEVTDLPVAANETKHLSVEAQSDNEIQAGNYDIKLTAQGGQVQADTALSAEVVGQANLLLTTPEGRLSGDAYVGKETPFQFVVQNSGSAPVRNIALNAQNPTGWSVEFDPKEIASLDAGKNIQVTAKVHPTDKAVAGDYMLNVSARPQDGSSKSVDFRVTVLTSTLWGIVGIGLIAVALSTVGVAVARFGRR